MGKLRSGQDPQQAKTKPKRKYAKRITVIVVLVIAAALFINAARNFVGRRSAARDPYIYTTVEKRDITDTLTGSGTLAPADSYTVTTLVSGDILSADFEEGQVVDKGDILYRIDSSDKNASIERAELMVSQSQRAYNKKLKSVADLTVKAPISGTLTGLRVKTGDMVSSQEVIAAIADTSTLTLTEFYSDEYKGKIRPGMSVTMSIPEIMMNLTATVTEVSDQSRISGTGSSCFAVTAEIKNPGSLAAGMKATCRLTSDGNSIDPLIGDDDGLDAGAVTAVYAKVFGTVTAIKARNDVTITAGQTILQLSSDTLDDEVQSAADALRDAELSLQSQYDSLENYTITAPIYGTIIEKNYKQGETAEIGKPLCMIYDLSTLTLTLHVDELDIAQVSVGQNAVITAEAVKGREYRGVITKIGINGTTSGGVTTYPVTIRIDETDGLLPGMNADVSIVVRESKGVPSIPAGAVAHSGKVLVKTSDGSTGPGAPEGYRSVQVETGASDADYVEILSGLREGDTIAYIPETANPTGFFGPMGFGARRDDADGRPAEDPDSRSGGGDTP